MSINQNVLNWYDSLDIRTKYRYEDETKLQADATASVGFVEMIQLRSAVSKNLLKDVLNRKSRVVMFGAGGTASWFLPKLLKIYNDAFTKCPEQAYDLEIVIMDHDEV